MTRLAVTDTLTAAHLTPYFLKGKLGSLQLPIGEHLHQSNCFSVELADVYKMAVRWKPTGLGFQPEEIIAIIVHGDTVSDLPHTERPYERRKYWLLGPKVRYIRREPLRPKSVNLLVITMTGDYDEQFVSPVTDMMFTGYFSAELLYEPGIRLWRYGITSLLQKINSEDVRKEALSTALTRGIPIVCDTERFKEICRSAGIDHTPWRSLYWDRSASGVLFGFIE